MPLSKPPYQLEKTACYISALIKHVNSTFNKNLDDSLKLNTGQLSNLIASAAISVHELTGLEFTVANRYSNDVGGIALQANDLITRYFRFISAKDGSIDYYSLISQLEHDANLIASINNIRFFAGSI